MKLLSAVRNKLGGVANAIIRFPVTFLLLVLIAAVNSVSIENYNNYGIEIISLVFAVFCTLAAQMLSERFAKKIQAKIIFYIAAAALSVCSYFMIRNIGEINIMVTVNTGTAVFALFVAFIWIPSIKGSADFNVVFMSIFKSLFTSAFYSAVLWGGISLILLAVNTLLFNLSGKVYMHNANFIWVVWAPVLFLSLIPVFNNDADSEKVQKASVYPKFLEIVLSYILVPLASVYTLVLLLYILKTAVGGSWQDNLLEPLMLSYCIAVLLLYILLSRLENRFALTFLKVFPVFLTFIAFFQIVSSAITVSSFGIIHSRYFVLMFGLYSAISGILLFMLPVKKNGIAAVLAICFALVCITPYINSFSVSIASQKLMIDNTLEKNNMLSDNTIIPNPDIPDNDKLILSGSVSYLSRIGKIDVLPYLPENFNEYENFTKTFGFSMYDSIIPEERFDRYYSLDKLQPIEITGYDYMTNIYFNMPGSINENENGTVVINGIRYHLLLTVHDFNGTLKITDTNKTELISVPLESLFDELTLIEPNQKKPVSAEKIILDYENDTAKLRLIVMNASIFKSSYENYRYAECYVLFKIK